MFKLIIAGVTATLLTFILLLGNIQTQREAVLKPYLEQVIQTIIASDANSVISQLHQEYRAEENRPANEKWLARLQEDLAALGDVTLISTPVLSYRSATRPFKTDRQADVYIVRTRFEHGDVLFRIGAVHAGNKKYYVDRLYISSKQIVDENGKRKSYSLKVKCSDEKSIKKHCFKDA